MKYTLNEKAKIIKMAIALVRSYDTREISNFFEEKLSHLHKPDPVQCPICMLFNTVKVNVPKYKCSECHHIWNSDDDDEITFDETKIIK
jgi:transposase-like protein